MRIRAYLQIRVFPSFCWFIVCRLFASAIRQRRGNGAVGAAEAAIPSTKGSELQEGSRLPPLLQKMCRPLATFQL